MLLKRIIPCLLLKDGLLVKTTQFSHPRHISEPIYAIKIFNDYEADEVIIVDSTISRDNNPDETKIPYSLISKISDESCMPITYGGGIRSIESIKQLFSAGIEKVCIGTYSLYNPHFIQQASSIFGSQSILVSIDVKKENGCYRVYTNCGSNPTNIEPVPWARKMEAMGAGEILLSSIDRDGMMNGYDLDLVRQVSSAVHIPVIAFGGAGKYEDLGDVLNIGGASAAAAGSLFVYYGKKRTVLINYPSKSEIDKMLKINPTCEH